MPAVTISSSAPTPQVPAWKRLGLKLKSTEQSSIDHAPSPTLESSKEAYNSKRARTGESGDELPAKKLKKLSKTTPHGSSSTKYCVDENPVTLKPGRKKSVTFTPETKVEDGDSIKQLFNAWVAEQKSQDPSFLLPRSGEVFHTPEPPRVKEEIEPKLEKSERRLKRVEQLKREKLRNSKNVATSTKLELLTSTSSSRPFLTYLRQYHDSRQTWKFNKNHQNHLVKHIFDVEVIPSDHSHLLYEYIRGLQGGARSRVRDAALAVKVKDLEDSATALPAITADATERQREDFMATTTAARMGHEEGILLDISDAAMRKRVARRIRAEQILAELGASNGEGEGGGEVETEKATGDDDSQKRLRMNDGSSQRVTRRRKQRTAAVDGDSSSSEDSSDSDEESSDGSASNNPDPDETSSSSSSSSSESEAEDESEGESEEDSESSDSE